MSVIHEDQGATAVEYALMVGLVSVVIAVGVTVFGIGVQGLFGLVPAGL